MSVEVVAIGPDRAADLLAVVRAAFGDRARLDPPADADAETADSLADRLSAHGGLLATHDGVAVGGLVLDLQGEVMFLRRVGVVPSAQRHGIAAALVAAARAVAAERGAFHLAVLAREELPASREFWERHGFVETARTPPYVQLRRPVAIELDAPDAEKMRGIGADLARRLRAGDVVLLVGELGAGKTTLTQGLADGLGVRGPITSPTFVIARVHPSEVEGPALVHVDAYRLGGIEELDDLDLDASLDEAVTVVEWGSGIAEGLAESRLEVMIDREVDESGEARTVRILPVGPRWEAEPW